MVKFHTINDMTEENIRLFIQEIEEIKRQGREKIKLLHENAPKRFNTFEEAIKHYNATPFEEWENKMIEKYGI